MYAIYTLLIQFLPFHIFHLGIGRDIQKRILDSIETEKLYDLRKAEEAVWVQAKKEKSEAVAHAREEERAIAEKVLRRKIKEYEQLIRVR